MFEEDDSTLRLMRLMRLRDSILNQILFGLREADRTSDLDLVRELELKVEECGLVSREINDLLEANKPPMESTH
jgi:hypothetical protein